MKIFLITAVIPRAEHGAPGVTAVHVVSYDLMMELRRLGHEIVLQVIFGNAGPESNLSSDDKNHLEKLKAAGFDVLEPINFRSKQPQTLIGNQWARLSRLLRLLLRGVQVTDFYPSTELSSEIEKRIRLSESNSVLSVWSMEGVAAVYGISRVPVVAFHGDIDFIIQKVRSDDSDLFSDYGFMSRLFKPIRNLEFYFFEQAHLKLMNRINVIANVTANNQRYYANHGHLRSIYVRNVWNRMPAEIKELPMRSGSEPIKIIGHVGYLDRTGSTYGLRFLFKEVMPCLDRLMAGREYKIDIIGGGELNRKLAPYSLHPKIAMRGFVKDLDSELASCDMMLLLNNAGPYQAAFTRHLVAWSMGLCLIAHAKSKDAIPELEDGQNVLMGSTGEQIAQKIFEAATQRELNMKIRKGGLRTYEQFFRAPHVAKRLSDELMMSASA